MELVIFWFILSIVAAAIASNNGRSGFGYLLLSLILSPMIGIICVIAAGKNVARLEQDQINDGSKRRCPYCEEIVRVEAVKCRHCGSALAGTIETDDIKNTTSYGWGRWFGSLFRQS